MNEWHELWFIYSHKQSYSTSTHPFMFLQRILVTYLQYLKLPLDVRHISLISSLGYFLGESRILSKQGLSNKSQTKPVRLSSTLEQLLLLLSLWKKLVVSFGQNMFIKLAALDVSDRLSANLISSNLLLLKI